jgi:sterol 3beta-glucosyltransferase
MHITILALGSHGDVFPFSVLGGGLVAAGYRVRLVTFENFRTLAEKQGLDFHSVRGDAQALMAGPGGGTLVDSGNNVFQGLRGILASFGDLSAEYVRSLTALLDFETDLVINQLPVFGDDICEKLGVPYFNAQVIPLNRTREFPIPLLPQLRLGAGYNRLSYRLAEQLGWQPFRKVINRWRVDTLGLFPKAFGGNFSLRSSEIPILAGFSSQVVPHPADWPPHIQVTGYWFPADDLTYSPPANLARYLDAGPPPILIGFGSMPIRNPETVIRTVAAALQRVDCRGIFADGWGDIQDEDLPDSILKIGYVPYNWLLPQMAGAVIHGGSGSTGAVLRAGIPTLVTPFVMDQFYWGRRIFELGVGPRPIPFKHLAVAPLATAFDQILHADKLRQTAAAIRTGIRAENGIRTAIEIIEKRLK